MCCVVSDTFLTNPNFFYKSDNLHNFCKSQLNNLSNKKVNIYLYIYTILSIAYSVTKKYRKHLITAMGDIGDFKSISYTYVINRNLKDSVLAYLSAIYYDLEYLRYQSMGCRFAQDVATTFNIHKKKKLNIL